MKPSLFKSGVWGFTLIELLVVVAIIAILAAIAVPNFLTAHGRAKVSRAKADLKATATALECYFVDNNTYPWDGNQGSYALTTPVSYITIFPIDPFSTRTNPGSDIMNLGTGNPSGKENIFPATLWLLDSWGPDCLDDTFGSSSYPFTPTACPYDPTNGTVSTGDIYLHSIPPPVNFFADANPEQFP